MARCSPIPLPLTDRARTQLEALVGQRTTAQQLATRARIILAADVGTGVRETATALRIRRSTVQRWRRRWRERAGLALTARLSDDPRAGTPPTFIPEEICAIIALACEPAARDGVELARWTQADLAEEAAARGIVESVSAQTLSLDL
jgi:putative transposase